MPTYDYQCRSCQVRFEIWQKMTDDPIAICPECGGPVRRILYPVGLVFKGTGFYKTDHNGSGTSASVPAATATKPDSAPSEGGESKAESPAAPAPAASNE